MPMKTIYAPLADSPSYNRILQLLSQADTSGASVLADGCVASQKLHLMGALSSDDRLHDRARFRLILTYSDLRAREIAEEYSFYDRNTLLYPAKDLIFFQADLRGREIETERIRCLRRIIEGRPTTIITTFAALMAPQVPLRTLRDSVLRIEKRGSLDLSDAAARLVSMGYEKNYKVERPGQFSIRGDILDIFDLTEENPFRVELWGDDIESIRSFDVLSQRSIEQLETIRIYPASEMILPGKRREDGLLRMQKEADRCVRRFRDEGRTEEAHRLMTTIREICEQAREWKEYGPLEGYIHYFYPGAGNFLELFDPESCLVFLDEPVRVGEHADAVEMEFRESMMSRAERGYILPGQMELFAGREQILARLAAYRRVGITELVSSSDFFVPDEVVSMHARSAASYNKSFAALTEGLKKYRKNKFKVIILTPSRTRARRLAQDLTDNGVTCFYTENPMRPIRPGDIMTCRGSIRHGYEYPEIGFAVITETDIFGAPVVRKKKKKTSSGDVIQDFSDLQVGDYVVHEDHGIGIYRGVEKIEVDRISKDYIKIEYGGGGTLYVLPTELNVLQKYASSSAAKPKINRLGGQEWSNTKRKVRGAVEEVADDLVKLYAARSQRKGHAFEKDTVWQHEFEELFPYAETADQLQAIEDTKKDMESDKIMDRLICGDVGFGKTEIAIRAAFKAVQDGKQVAVLVPTTILAQQHYSTFTERMHTYPINIGLLSRFRTAAEQKKTLKDLESGMCDIVIGTHRLLSKDVHFKDLGLLVVDEEQRFGVTHKEKIKKLREDVDVLTLSATPIPRTLHMSLVGIRDMSLLEEAPEGRVPIQTYVMEYNEEMVREAIVRELSRGGQVYYVHNRINDIDLIADRLRQLVPEARIEFGHGRMSESQLENLMYDFVSGRIDVLVSTTIIETGMDISNVNTIIIGDSDRMGLSQLYQLRGRVGRSGRTAYAFLMYKRDRVLREVAEKRLSAIREFTDMGSGFRIAMRDLEIRGAGSILGRAQHGHMSAVGYDLYCKLLGEAVRRAKGEETPPEKTVTVHLNVDAFIPEAYIMNEVQKLETYKKIAAISCKEDFDSVCDELKDRFGDIPASAENLLRIALIRSVASHLDITDITGNAGEITITMDEKARIKVEKIPLLLQRYRGGLRFFAKGGPFFRYTYKPVGLPVRDEEILLNTVEELLISYAALLR